MSSASTPSISQIPPFVIPIITEYAKQIKPPIAFLMVGTVFASMLIPLLISLFYFSTPEKRRTPMFILVAFDVLLGIGLGFWNGYIMIHSVLSPLDTSSSAKYIPFVTLFLLSPWLIDIVLLVRLLSVFPPVSTPRLKFVAIFTFPAIIKTVRLVMVILLARQWEHDAHALMQNNIGAGQSQSWAHSIYFKAEWICQIIDNAYVSAFFLWKLRDSAFNKDRIAVIKTPNSIGRRLKTLFWIAATNFVFPILFDIAQMVIFYHYPYFTSAYVTYTSIYVSIIGVVFATVWASSSVDRPNHSSSMGSLPTRSNNIYTFKPSLVPHTLGSVGSTSSGSGTPREKKGFRASEDRGPTMVIGSDIPLQIHVNRTHELDVV